MHEIVRRLIAERVEQDRKEGRLLLLMGVPLALLGWVGMAGALWLVQLLAWTVLPWSLSTAFWISAAVALAAIVSDCILHPAEEWHEASYYLLDGTTSANTGAIYGRAGGAFDGMPLMTNMSDPGNWAERGKVISSGCSNIVLAGPRHIRKGLGKLLLAKRRSDPRILEGVVAFVGWLAESGSVVPDEADAILAANSRWKPGAQLASGIGLICSVRDVDGRTVLTLASTLK